MLNKWPSLRLERNPALRTPPPVSMVPSVSVLKGFDWLDFQDLAWGGGGGGWGGGGGGGGVGGSRPTTFVPSHFQIRSYNAQTHYITCM